MKTLNVIKQNSSCCTTAKDIEVQETFNDLNKEYSSKAPTSRYSFHSE